MKQIAILYGSTTGNTKEIAELIQKKTTGYETILIDVNNAQIEDIDNYKNLIIGSPTWGLGDLQDDWENFLPVLSKTNLEGKTIALFGLGDSASYPDTFVDAMGIIYETIMHKGCNIVGATKIDGYSFSESKALNNGTFVGLPLDLENEYDLTNVRLDTWLASIISKFN